jgi:5-formyltetrahydrofolate cyclo-ligase
MDKKELRKHYTALRSGFDPTQIDSLSIAISNRLLPLPLWQGSYYHIFLPIPSKNEIDTSHILAILFGKDKNVVIPKVVGNTLTNYLLTDQTRLKTSSWGVPEPMDGLSVPEELIDVVFIPLLAYDHQGNRVGYGKGFYDTLLAKCKPSTIKVGLSFFGPAQRIEDVRPGDIPLDYCVTPEQVYRF